MSKDLVPMIQLFLRDITHHVRLINNGLGRRLDDKSIQHDFIFFSRSPELIYRRVDNAVYKLLE